MFSCIHKPETQKSVLNRVNQIHTFNTNPSKIYVHIILQSNNVSQVVASLTDYPLNLCKNFSPLPCIIYELHLVVPDLITLIIFCAESSGRTVEDRLLNPGEEMNVSCSCLLCK